MADLTDGAPDIPDTPPSATAMATVSEASLHAALAHAEPSATLVAATSPMDAVALAVAAIRRFIRLLQAIPVGCFQIMYIDHMNPNK